jgi:hypothetical protein
MLQHLALVAIGPLKRGDASGLHKRATLVVRGGRGASAVTRACERAAALCVGTLNGGSDACAPGLKLVRSSVQGGGLGQGSEDQNEGGNNRGLEHGDDNTLLVENEGRYWSVDGVKS